MKTRFPARTALVTAVALCMSAPAFAADHERPLQFAQASAGGGGSGNSSGSTGNASAGGGTGLMGSGTTGTSGANSGATNDSGAGGSSDKASPTRMLTNPRPATASTATPSGGMSGGTPSGAAAASARDGAGRAQDRSMNRDTMSRNDGASDSSSSQRRFSHSTSPAYGDHIPQELGMDRRGHAGVQPGATDTRAWLRPESDNAQSQ